MAGGEVEHLAGQVGSATKEGAVERTILSIGGDGQAELVTRFTHGKYYPAAASTLRHLIRDYLHQEFGANYGDDRVLVSSHGVIIAHFYLTSERRITHPPSITSIIILLSYTHQT